MCYITPDDSTVGVRELRQNLSVYLRRVEAGETLSVTARGKRVAVLAPAREEMDAWDRMVAEGKIRPATRDMADLPPPLPAPPGWDSAKVLDEIRADTI